MPEECPSCMHAQVCCRARAQTRAQGRWNWRPSCCSTQATTRRKLGGSSVRRSTAGGARDILAGPSGQRTLSSSFAVSSRPGMLYSPRSRLSLLFLAPHTPHTAKVGALPANVPLHMHQIIHCDRGNFCIIVSRVGFPTHGHLVI